MTPDWLGKLNPTEHIEEAQRLLGWAEFNREKKKNYASMILLEKTKNHIQLAINKIAQEQAKGAIQMVECPDCRGDGFFDLSTSDETIDCEKCGGSGLVDPETL